MKMHLPVKLTLIIGPIAAFVFCVVSVMVLSHLLAASGLPLLVYADIGVAIFAMTWAIAWLVASCIHESMEEDRIGYRYIYTKE